MEQPAQAEATEARGDPKSLQPGYRLVRQAYFGVVTSALLFKTDY
jgi:hypothetical protein